MASNSNGYTDQPESLGEKSTHMVELLATFTVSKESTIGCPVDGMRKFFELEKTTGIESQKMQLSLDHQWISIIDSGTGVGMGMKFYSIEKKYEISVN